MRKLLITLMALSSVVIGGKVLAEDAVYDGSHAGEYPLHLWSDDIEYRTVPGELTTLNLYIGQKNEYPGVFWNKYPMYHPQTPHKDLEGISYVFNGWEIRRSQINPRDGEYQLENLGLNKGSILPPSENMLYLRVPDFSASYTKYGFDAVAQWIPPAEKIAPYMHNADVNSVYAPDLDKSLLGKRDDNVLTNFNDDTFDFMLDVKLMENSRYHPYFDVYIDGKLYKQDLKNGDRFSLSVKDAKDSKIVFTEEIIYQ